MMPQRSKPTRRWFAATRPASSPSSARIAGLAPKPWPEVLGQCRCGVRGAEHGHGFVPGPVGDVGVGEAFADHHRLLGVSSGACPPVARVVAVPARRVAVLRSVRAGVEVPGLEVDEATVRVDGWEDGTRPVLGEPAGAAERTRARVGTNPVDTEDLGIKASLVDEVLEDPLPGGFPQQSFARLDVLHRRRLQLDVVARRERATNRPNPRLVGRDPGAAGEFLERIAVVDVAGVVQGVDRGAPVADRPAPPALDPASVDADRHRGMHVDVIRYRAVPPRRATERRRRSAQLVEERPQVGASKDLVTVVAPTHGRLGPTRPWPGRCRRTPPRRSATARAERSPRAPPPATAPGRGPAEADAAPPRR